jgi:hypothetical protein
MPSSDRRPPVRLLLDEHYPPWLAEELCGDGLDVAAITAGHGDLRGADDETVLRTATRDGRVVVTEDVNTFGAAIAQVPAHAGVTFCHAARFPRTPTGLPGLRRVLLALAETPPRGLGLDPLVIWLEPAPE